MRIGPTVLTSRTTEILGWTPQRTQRELVAVRVELGPPWRHDHKQAALAALSVLGP